MFLILNTTESSIPHVTLCWPVGRDMTQLEDGNGGLTVEEFVDGALKLKGPAKGIAAERNLTWNYHDNTTKQQSKHMKVSFVLWLTWGLRSLTV